MKYIGRLEEGARGIGKGWLNKLAICALGIALFLAAHGAAAAGGDQAMTQHQYLQWMANICGEALPPSASDADLMNWARGKGMNPTGGWNPGARLTKEVTAQTLVQLLKLAPPKGDFDAVRILEREGIPITTSGGYVTANNFRRLIDNGVACRPKPNRGDDDDDSHGGGGHGGDDDDRPTPTRPGHGHGDKNHDHTGPPGSGPKPPQKD
jgi:hypothetical protein